MCGIVGFIGEQPAAPILLEGLSKLEYRGYDSAGIAVRNEKTDKIAIVKAEVHWFQNGSEKVKFKVKRWLYDED